MVDSFPWKELLVGLGGVLFGGLVVVVLLSQRYSLRARKGKFAGVEYDISRFSDLTQVKFFNHVTMVALPAAGAEAGAPQASHDPVALIYAGWMLVSETFLRRFGAIPSEENVAAHAAELGAQTADFINSFRVVQDQAVRNAGQVTLAFAQGYASRAPSLAHRIDPSTWRFDESLAVDLLKRLPPAD